MNMFAESASKSIAEYLSAIPDDRKETIDFLHDFIQKKAPSLTPYFASNMLGYGSFTYLDSKKKENNWPVIALANQKNYISLYVCAVENGEYLAEKYADDLGKVNVGRSCIRFKKLENLNLKTLEKVLKASVDNAGLVGAKTV